MRQRKSFAHIHLWSTFLIRYDYCMTLYSSLTISTQSYMLNFQLWWPCAFCHQWSVVVVSDHSILCLFLQHALCVFCLLVCELLQWGKRLCMCFLPTSPAPPPEGEQRPVIGQLWDQCKCCTWAEQPMGRLHRQSQEQHNNMHCVDTTQVCGLFPRMFRPIQFWYWPFILR